MKLKTPDINQLNEIIDLINLAYRGDKGWTTETDIVDGTRVSASEIKCAIDDPCSHFLVYSENGKLCSCICVHASNDRAHIGLFAVHPDAQQKGIGKQVLAAAEKYATTNLSIKKYLMAVISQRTELISYYERRGYVRTGKSEQYPLHLDVGMPKTDGLTIEYLEKSA